MDSWLAAILEENNSIGVHAHAFHENTFGWQTLSLPNLDTTTDYYFLVLVYTLIGGNLNETDLHCFLLWLEHKVDPNTTGEVRYSVAFDRLPNMPWIMFRKTVWKMRKLRILFCCQRGSRTHN